MSTESQLPISASNKTPEPAPARSSSSAESEPARGALSASGWLGADGVYSHDDDRKIGRAMSASLAVHGAIVAALIALFAIVPQQVFDRPEPLEFKVAFVPEKGPGGGGGGSPA